MIFGVLTFLDLEQLNYGYVAVAWSCLGNLVLNLDDSNKCLAKLYRRYHPNLFFFAIFLFQHLISGKKSPM